MQQSRRPESGEVKFVSTDALGEIMSLWGYLMKNWQGLNDENFGLMFTLSNSIKEMEGSKPKLLPNLRQGDTIFVFSDYSGQHTASSFEVYSFLYVDINHCHMWFAERTKIREKYLPDGRRISFKNLNDKKRAKSLYPFLYASDNIPGLSITFVIDKRIESMFLKEGKLNTNSTELEKYNKWKNKTFEHLLRIVHLNCLIISGLSKEDQDVYWITDDDDIVANVSKLTDLTNIFGIILSNYLSHNLRHIRCGSAAATDDGSRTIEDFCAIPDLVAGALTEVLSKYKQQGIWISKDLIVPKPKSVSNKSTKIMNWLSDKQYSLKKLVCMIEPEENTTPLKSTWLKFIGTNDCG